MIEAVAAHRDDTWHHTSELLAMALNCAAKKHVVHGHQLHPWRKREPQPLMLSDMSGML